MTTYGNTPELRSWIKVTIMTALALVSAWWGLTFAGIPLSTVRHYFN